MSRLIRFSLISRKEHWQKLSEVEWPKLASILRAENGLWPDIESGPVTWRLDGSEGPLRMRNRLERIHGAPELGAQRTRHQLRDAIPSVDELSSAVSRLNTAPWEDPFALALGEAAPIPEEGMFGTWTCAEGRITIGPADSDSDSKSKSDTNSNSPNGIRRCKR